MVSSIHSKVDGSLKGHHEEERRHLPNCRFCPEGLSCVFRERYYNESGFGVDFFYGDYSLHTSTHMLSKDPYLRVSINEQEQQQLSLLPLLLIIYIIHIQATLSSCVVKRKSAKMVTYACYGLLDFPGKQLSQLL